jgi:molybdenum cofactor cytidylyltransferase
MGRLKQVLAYGSGTLVQNAVEQARQAGFSPIVVVIGAEASQVRASLSGLPVEIAENRDWALGMGSSIICGMKALEQSGVTVNAVAVLLADQPLVKASHLNRMGEAFTPDHFALAAEYDGSIGVPAIFGRKLFADLRSLPPHMGAKQLLRRLGADVARFPLPEAGADIDTPEDYARLTS